MGLSLIPWSSLMPSRNQDLSKHSNPQQYRAWLLRHTTAEKAIRMIRLIRTSGRSIDDWEESAKTSFATSDKTNPDVQTALALGYDVIRNDSVGEAAREALGDSVLILRMGHAPGGKGDRRLGVALHIGNTLFLYLLTSARANDLAADSPDRRGNAFTEILSEAARTVYRSAKQHDPDFQLEVHAREHARIVRSERHGADVKETLQACRAIVYRPDRLDMSNSTEARSFSFGSMMAEESLEALVRGMNRPEVLMQTEGLWYESLLQAPFTHEPAKFTRVDPRTGIEITTHEKHRLAVVDNVDEARRIMRALVDRILADDAVGAKTDWIAVGNLAAEFDLPSRSPEHLSKGIRLRQLDGPARARAVRSLFTERYIEAWRTGSFSKEVKEKFDLHLDLPDVETERREDGLYYKCRIAMPLPEGGWGISDDEWDEVLRRRYPGRFGSAAPRQRQTELLPLASMVEVDNEESGEQLHLSTDGLRYLLVTRPLSEAYVNEARVGWDRRSRKRIAACSPQALHASIGEAMEKGLLSAAAADLADTPLRLHTPPPLAESGTREYAIAAARTHLQDCEDQLAGAEDHCARASGRLRREPIPESQAAVDRAERAVARAEDAQRDATAALRKLESEANLPATQEEVTVETVTAEFLAVALQKCDGLAPTWMNRTCHHFLRNWDIRVEHPTTGPATVRWSCDLVLLDPADGREVALPVEGQVSSTARSRQGKPVNDAEGFAWSHFYDGHTLAQIAERAGLESGTVKNGYLFTQLSWWLTPLVPHQSLRTAAIQCPVPETGRVLYASVTGQDAALTGLDPAFVAHIRTTYTQREDMTSWNWCRGSFDLPRRIADLLARADGTLPLADVCEALAVSKNAVLALTRTSPQRISLARTEIAYFTKNFTRSGNLSIEDRAISLRPCPHSDCPATMRGQNAWCSIVLRTPETEAGHGVLCPSCLRCPVPHMAKIRFPSGYARPWIGTFERRYAPVPGTEDHVRLDPHRSDTPTTPLQDFGCRPRPGARVGRHITADIRGSDMRGARVVIDHDMDKAIRDQVAEHLIKHGGRTAVRINATLAAFVSDRDPDPHIATRLAQHAIPVVTPADFIATPPATWATNESHPRV